MIYLVIVVVQWQLRDILLSSERSIFPNGKYEKNLVKESTCNTSCYTTLYETRLELKSAYEKQP